MTDLVKRLHIKIDQASRNETNKKVLYTNDTWFEILPKFYGAEVHDFFRTVTKIDISTALNFIHSTSYHER